VSGNGESKTDVKGMISIAGGIMGGIAFIGSFWLSADDDVKVDLDKAEARILVLERDYVKLAIDFAEHKGQAK
jgi:hypothetical protein